MKLPILLVAILLVACNFFPKDETLIASHKTSNGQRINIYFVALGATTEDVIQIRKANPDRLLKAYEHNYLIESKIINSSTLRIILSDTAVNGMSSRIDTFLLNIN
jgi:hypothetical protein